VILEITIAMILITIADRSAEIMIGIIERQTDGLTDITYG
jgi:hypothetical protein